MNNYQIGIIETIPAAGRYLVFSLVDRSAAVQALRRLRDGVDSRETVVGVGASLLAALGVEIEGLREFPSFSATGVEVPATPAALWLWLRGSDRGELFQRGRSLVGLLAPAFLLRHSVDAFWHDGGRDLTGYEDGTENPQGAEALAAAFVNSGAAGLDGSSFVAVQQWVHDFTKFNRYSTSEQDDMIGRRRSDNEELEDAPPSAHVKRTAQESFTPEAFLLRRSMPWSEAEVAGLMFVAFGRSLDVFEAQLRRMTGGEDGIVDALFSFTRPVSGAYFWCPPLCDGRLDLSRLGV